LIGVKRRQESPTKFFWTDFQRAGYPILADLEEYVPNGDRLHAIATTGPCLDKNYTAIVGYPTSTIRAYRFMETRSNHAKKVRIIDNSDLKFEERYEPIMWEEEAWPLRVQRRGIFLAPLFLLK
jgi:hypothetical protein